MPGQTECQDGGMASCIVGEGSCFVWGHPVPCAAGFTCANSGSSTACAAIPAPRPIAPLSTATVTSRSPTFRWAPASGNDGAEVEVYRDRACTLPVTTFLAANAAGAAPLVFAPGVYFWRLRGVAEGAVGDATSAVWEFVVGARSAPVDTSWGTILDVNGDGFADVVRADPDTNAAAADLRVYFGGAAGLSSTPVVVPAPVPAGSGAAFGEFQGYDTTVASAGDVNGDGFDDVVVGAPGCCGVMAGSFYVFLGGPAGLSSSPLMITGKRYFASNVSPAGDVNGDGYADIAIGSDTGDGAFVYLGGRNGIQTNPVVLPGTVGETFAGVGDVNGDGFGDVVVGEYRGSRSGTAVLYLGSAGGPVPMPIALAGPGDEDAFFGYAVDGAGDVNGDGYADIAVGAPGAAPQVRVFLGGADGVVGMPIALADPNGPSATIPSIPSFSFGRTLAGVRDVDGDGFADLVVGAPGFNQGQGAAYLYFGGPAGPIPLDNVSLGSGLVTVGYFGASTAGVGDVDGDGLADFVVDASFSGAGYVYGGLGGARTPTVKLILTP
jgi:hypothetical protein